MSHIFICYSKQDGNTAQQLVRLLEAEGWTVFIDQKTQVGHRWHKVIETELHAAKAVVVLWSATSRDSDYVLEEAEYGKRKNILFPALIEAVEFPYGFGRIQTADLTGWRDQPQHAGLAQLLDSLRLHLNDDVSESASVSAKPSLVPGQTFRDALRSGGEGPLMTVIPAGRFMMGSPEDEPGRNNAESPQHEVIIAQPFALGVYAVTFDEYDWFCQKIMREKPNNKEWGRRDRPVIFISWYGAQEFCIWLSKQTGQLYRLPSEAEWEYACRAGTTTPFSAGEMLSPDQANFRFAHGEGTLPVGRFLSNTFGLYDMHGNVWEWIQDCWHENYQNAPNRDSAWLEVSGGNCDRRVVRGGGWSDPQRCLRSASRAKAHPADERSDLGFRIARVL